MQPRELYNAVFLNMQNILLLVYSWLFKGSCQ